MFDYQAGERYKLTLIFVGIAGLMAGVFFTLLLGSTGEPPRPQRGRGARGQSAMIPPGSGKMRGNTYQQQQQQQQLQPTGPQNASEVDSTAARDLIHNFAPLSFDMSAATCDASQAQAIQMMTPEFANTYRATIWTPELSRLVKESGVQSSFTLRTVQALQANADGSIAVRISGTKLLTKMDGESQSNEVNMEYLCQKDTNGQFKVAGIKDQ